MCRLVEKERPANLLEEPSCSPSVPQQEREQDVTTQTELPKQTLTPEDKVERAKELIRKTNEAKQLEEQEVIHFLNYNCLLKLNIFSCFN